MPAKYDAIVIGGGHDGLTWTFYLPKVGLKAFVPEHQAGCFWQNPGKKMEPDQFLIPRFLLARAPDTGSITRIFFRWTAA